MPTAELQRGKKQREWYLEDVVRVFVREAVAAQRTAAGCIADSSFVRMHAR